MLKVLVLAAQNNVADARMEYLIRDRLSWLRFLGFDLGAPTSGNSQTIPSGRMQIVDSSHLLRGFDYPMIPSNTIRLRSTNSSAMSGSMRGRRRGSPAATPKRSCRNLLAEPGKPVRRPQAGGRASGKHTLGWPSSGGAGLRQGPATCA